MSQPLEPGTFVRAKARTMSGWKGIGRVILDDGDGTVQIQKLPSSTEGTVDTADFCRDQLAVLRVSRPNPSN